MYVHCAMLVPAQNECGHAMQHCAMGCAHQPAPDDSHQHLVVSVDTAPDPMIDHLCMLHAMVSQKIHSPKI